MEFEDNISTYISNLKDLVLDENKLVTYLSLSKDLCIHVNRSKTLLSVFLESIRKEKPNLKLNVNYLVSGLINKNCAKITVCTEGMLNDTKNAFSTVFYSHIYSINKGHSTIDLSAYVNLNQYDDFNLCSGLIKNSNNVKRSSNEINTLKSNSQETIDTKPIISKCKKIPSNESILKNGKSEKIIKSEPTIAEIVKKEILSPPKEDVNTKQNKSNKKGIVGYFNKQNGSIKKNIQKQSKIEKDDVSEKMEVDEVKPIDTKLKTGIQKESCLSDNNKVLNEIKSKAKVDKKRKRVLHVSDSDSEEENQPIISKDTSMTAPESDDEIPGTPVANVKITSGIVNAKKKRKIVDKTYMDDDGYILTKREEVYESCSDNEHNNQEVKEDMKKASPKETPSEIKTTKKKISPPQKGKQSTMMNFFKKK